MANPILNRIPPSSLEAEQSILGSMLLSEVCVTAAMGRISETHFYTEAHRRIFRAMSELFAANQPIDLTTVVSKLEINRKLELEEISYITELSSRVPSTKNIGAYIDIVMEKSVLRQLIDICGNIADTAFSGEEKSDEILNYAGDLIYRLTEGKATRTLEQIRPAMMEAYEMIGRAAKNKGGLMGIATGFRRMDRLLSGFQPSQLIIVAGRPGMGKTSFALNIAEHIGMKENVPVAIFSLEMAREQLAMRLLCGQAGVDSQKARTGSLSDKDFEDLAEAMVPLGDSKIYVDDNASITVTAMQAKLRNLMRQTGEKIGAVIIDYLQLMTAGTRVESRQQEISLLTRNLKIMSRELSVPIVLLSQLSRENEKRKNKRPMLSDLRESGAIEQDADVVIFLHRDDYYPDDENSQGKSYIIVAKQRNGPTDSIEVAWRGEQTKYTEVDYSQSSAQS